MPVVVVPAPCSGMAKPAVRAKLPPLVIGRTTGTLVMRLNGSGDPIKAGLRPSARVPVWDQARPARFRRASSDQLATDRLVIEPLMILPSARRFRIALRQQLIERIVRPVLRLHDQPAAPDGQSHLRAWPQVQDIEQLGRHGQHDRAAYLAEICLMHESTP